MNKLPYLIQLNNREVKEFNEVVSDDSQIRGYTYYSPYWYSVLLSPEESTIIRLKFPYMYNDTSQPNVTAYSE